MEARSACEHDESSSVKSGIRGSSHDLCRNRNTTLENVAASCE